VGIIPASDKINGMYLMQVNPSH